MEFLYRGGLVEKTLNFFFLFSDFQIFIILMFFININYEKKNLFFFSFFSFFNFIQLKFEQVHSFHRLV